ncbi:hypothetical protein DFH06DRAFT_1233262 [Mycena polygramma]|nr:hypothetical protein DFH06DRAFT_1245730 [Mycena polygramma]KAJ7620838.1 hypothetical protein DFH06DRAFT_1233262 [Mycena polygramma]
MSHDLRTDRVRAIGIMKLRANVAGEDLKAKAQGLIAAVKAIPAIQQNILKYEITVKHPGLTLASEMGLKESDLGLMVLVEAASHDKIKAALTSPEYKKIVADALATTTSIDDYHWFSGEFVTVIDK